MRTRLHPSFRAAAAGCVLLSACHGAAVPNQVFTKPAPVRPSTPILRTSGLWPFHPSFEPQAFTVDQQAVVTFRTDTVTRTDTVSSHAEVVFRASPAKGGITGSVGTFRVQAPGQVAARPAGLVLPFSFHAVSLSRAVQLDFTSPSDVTPCASTELSVAQSLRDLWFQPPDTLRAGLTWEDSSTYVVCRDSIPLRATVHRLFRVSGSAEREGRLLLSISRLTRLVLQGAGQQFGEPVTVSGAGSGQLVYDFDVARGEVLSASGSATLDFALRSRLRTQLVRQALEIRIGRS